MDRTEKEELNCWSELFCISWWKKCWSLCAVYIHTYA